MTDSKVQALKFTQGGAPLAWSMIPGVPGLFHPDHPMPIDDEPSLTVEYAKLLAKDPGCPLEVVSITAAQADEYRNLRKAGQ